MPTVTKILGGFSVILAVGLIFLWFAVGEDFYRMYQQTSLQSAPEDLALQDDALVPIPPQEPQVLQPYNSEKNVYWGDLHVHTEASFDAKLFGTNLTVEDAYRFSKGETLDNAAGERMQLVRPLDFVAITDHAEGFGIRSRCGDDGLNWIEKANCAVLESSNSVFMILGLQLSRSQMVSGDATAPPGVYQPVAHEPTGYSLPICQSGQGGVERCYQESNDAWSYYIEMADRYNQPGVLTTFAAYEFSPIIPGGGKHHRNVIFNDTKDLPAHAISSLDVPNAIELWRGLGEACVGDCDFLTIPHNMNLG